MKRFIILAGLVVALTFSFAFGREPNCDDYFHAILGSFSTDSPASDANRVFIDEFAGTFDCPRCVVVGGKEMSLLDALDHMMDHCGDSHEIIWNPTGAGSGVMVRKSGTSNSGFNFSLPDGPNLSLEPFILSGAVILFTAVFLLVKRFSS